MLTDCKGCWLEEGLQATGLFGSDGYKLATGEWKHFYGKRETRLRHDVH